MPKTTLLLETIKIEEGIVHNLEYHQKRLDRSTQALFKRKSNIVLYNCIKAPQKGLYRCRIIYDEKIHSIEYIPYIPKEISSLKIITSTIDYQYKYANRETLNILIASQPETDDILIEKDGLITDTSIANIAFYTEGRWLTPTSPLLEGTVRAKLLDEGFLKKENITIDDLEKYSHVALMNAMIGFNILNNITITDTKGKHHDY